MELLDYRDDPYLKVLRPLVETYLAFIREDSRHIRAMGLTPSQFDVLVTLGDTDGMTCRDLSDATLVTKGTLTGVLDRLAGKGLIERSEVEGDRRCIHVRLTSKGNMLYRKVFSANTTLIRPYVERALSKKDADQLRTLLLRLRDSFSPTLQNPN